jgi:hypothetical protein
MKNQIILLSLAIGGLLITSHSAVAASPEVTQLSRTITNLIDLDADSQNLVTKAIDRALIVKEIQNNSDSSGDSKTPRIQSPRGRYPQSQKSDTTTKKVDETAEHEIKQKISTTSRRTIGNVVGQIPLTNAQRQRR